MLHDTKVDETFFKLVCAEYLAKKIKDGCSLDEIKNVGRRIGSRLADDFFLKNETKRVSDVYGLCLCVKQFLRTYFGYEPKVDANKVLLDGFFLRGNRASLVMVSGVVECIFSYVFEGKAHIGVEEDSHYVVTAPSNA